jgi:hypothetical protein
MKSLKISLNISFVTFSALSVDRIRLEKPLEFVQESI